MHNTLARFTSPQGHPYWAEDVIDVFGKTFAGNRMIGGRKAFWHPRLNDSEEWVIHARYLLTEATEEHIDTLMLTAFHPDWGGGRSGFLDLIVGGAASWLAGLLKHRGFIEVIGELAVTGGRKWYTNAFYASLLLYDDPSVAQFYQSHLTRYSPEIPWSQSNWNADSAPLALHCLRILDQRFGTSYSHPYADVEVPSKHATLIDQLLWMSAVLRCELTFETAEELQSRLTQLLQDTITISQYQRGLLWYPPIRRRLVSLEERRELYRSVREAYSSGQPQDLRQLHKLLAMVDEKTFGNHEREFVSNDRRISNAAVTFLAAEDAGVDQIETLRDSIRGSKNFVDISRMLEINAIHQYRIPGDIIVLCFERLLDFVPPSYDFYEQFALTLVFYGQEYDARARGLWDLAQGVKSRYARVEEKDFDTPQALFRRTRAQGYVMIRT